MSFNFFNLYNLWKFFYYCLYRFEVRSSWTFAKVFGPEKRRKSKNFTNLWQMRVSTSTRQIPVDGGLFISCVNLTEIGDLIDMIQLLINRGANVDAKTDTRRNSLHLLCVLRRITIWTRQRWKSATNSRQRESASVIIRVCIVPSFWF